MLQEAIQKIAGLVEEKNKLAHPVTFLTDRLPDKVFIVHNGQLLERDVDTPPRSHYVASVADVLEILKVNGASEPDADKRLSVWVSEEQIVVVLDSDKLRKNRVTMKLVKSHLFGFIAGLIGKTSGYTQAETIRILRHELRNAEGQAEMLRAVRSVNFTKNESTSSTIDVNQRDQLGKVVDEQVAFGDGVELPEMLKVRANIFRNPGETLDDIEGEEFEISVETDIQNKKFILRVMEDDVHKKVVSVLKDLAESISMPNPKLPVYFGTV